MSSDYQRIVRDGLWDNNGVLAMLLGLCPTMAMTTSATNGLGMGLATALVMAVTAKLIVFPTGSLADSPLWLRLAAAGLGFATFLVSGQRVIVGVVVSLVLLSLGLALL